MVAGGLAQRASKGHRLDLGQYAQVQEMVVNAMAWVFNDVRIHREAMAALTLFREAV